MSSPRIKTEAEEERRRSPQRTTTTPQQRFLSLPALQSATSSRHGSPLASPTVPRSPTSPNGGPAPLSIGTRSVGLGSGPPSPMSASGTSQRTPFTPYSSTPRQPGTMGSRRNTAGSANSAQSTPREAKAAELLRSRDRDGAASPFSPPSSTRRPTTRTRAEESPERDRQTSSPKKPSQDSSKGPKSGLSSPAWLDAVAKRQLIAGLFVIVAAAQTYDAMALYLNPSSFSSPQAHGLFGLMSGLVTPFLKWFAADSLLLTAFYYLRVPKLVLSKRMLFWLIGLAALKDYLLFGGGIDSVRSSVLAF